MDRRYEKRINRYWVKMQSQCREVLGEIASTEWFDFWHTHLDWDGKGNARVENRIRCNELTYEMLKLAESITDHRGNDIQCFAIIKENSMDNSIYIHSQNPNGSEFPFRYAGVDWEYSDSQMAKIIDCSCHELGIFKGDDEATIFIRKKA